MEETRKNIQKSAKIIYTVSRIAEVVLVISCLAALVGIIISFTDADKAREYLSSMFSEEGILEQFRDSDLFLKLSPERVLLIGAIIHLITRGMLLVYTHFLAGLLKSISDGNQPFTVENAERLKKIAYFAPVFLIYSPLTAGLLFIVGLFFSHLVRYGTYLHEKASETGRIQEDMIVSFAEVVENKSEQTGQHVKRVAEYSRIIAEEMGLAEEQAEKIRLASMMHDIGKLMIPSEILEKPGRLTDDEYTEIKKHSGYGGKLLNSVEGDVMVLAKNIALEHHERVDGHGYPDGKSGDAIGIEGRIVAVADVYDALTSKRSYKEAWDDRKAYDEIVKGSGTQFDSEVVEVFKRAYPRIDSVRKELADAV